MVKRNKKGEVSNNGHGRPPDATKDESLGNRDYGDFYLI